MSTASNSRLPERTTPAGSFQVIAWLKPKTGRQMAQANGFVRSKLATQDAFRVFAPDRTVSAAGATPGRDIRRSMPLIVAIGAEDEYAARALLEECEKDSEVDRCYVAPPRLLLSRSVAFESSQEGGDDDSLWPLEMLRIPSEPPPCEGVTVGVVDSGVDTTHPDLKDAVEKYVNFTSEPDEDKYGHGTHVCGIIAARGVAPEGMKGACRARLHVYKGIASVYDATAYYRALGEALETCKVVNLSLGGEWEDDTETALIEAAIEDGVVVVAAMGNEFLEENKPQFPAAIAGVMAVGAVDKDRQKAEFSNSGKHIFLVAPGVEIRSTVPTYSTEIFGEETHYAVCKGTSMAAPYLTATIAMMLARALHPEDGNSVKEYVVMQFCSGQTAWSEELGGGILDIDASLSNIPATLGGGSSAV